MKKKLLALLLAAVMTASLCALPAGAAAKRTDRFSDLSDSQSILAAESLRLLGIMDGYGDGTFRPGAQLNRAQFCKMVICATQKENEMGQYRTVTVYPDVKPSHWAAGYINMAAKGKNIISGYPDGKFYPDRVVTLGQAVTILLRLLDYKDEHVGGVWPNSYLSAAAKIGLTENLSTANPNAPLTRAQAAQMFVNLLRADCREGASFLSTTGVELKEDVVLVSSSATGPDGKDTALQTASGQLYQIADGKTSNGCFNGLKGTLLMKNGKVVSFLPDAKGSNKTVVVSKLSALQITDTTGSKYALSNDTSVFYNSKEQSWSEVYTWLNPGTSLTLYLGAAGNVEYIFVGGGSTASEAVIVYKKGSTDNFKTLTGGASGYTIYKNGVQATAADMRPYDVATYSSATNSIRVCDVRLTGYYESCKPNPKEPTSITVFGQEFPVLTTAQATLATFRPGDQMTLLLTEDNQIAGAVKPDTSGAGANAVGIVKSISSSSAEVELLCGITIKGGVSFGSSDDMDMIEKRVQQMQNQLVRVTSQGKNMLGLVRLGGGVSGALDIEARKLGSVSLAANVRVFEHTSDGVRATSLEELSGGSIPAARIGYARTNWRGQVDILVLGGVNDGTTVYGRTSVTMQGDDDNITYYMEVVSSAGRVGPFVLRYDIPGGVYVAAVVDASGTNFASLQRLNKLEEVPNTAWSGQAAVTVGGQTYTVPGDVQCYNRGTNTWVSLDEAHAYADEANMYESEGVIRIIEVNH